MPTLKEKPTLADYGEVKVIKVANMMIVAGMLFSARISNATTGFTGCSNDPKIQKARSAELQKLYKEDQSDYRSVMVSSPQLPLDVKKLEEMSKNDLKRRKRVGEIFGEGCFQSAPDYAAAAGIFQHGDVSDHFFQAFTWSKEAVALGDLTQKSEMALAVDRYLVKIGHKQLFGSQLTTVGAVSSATASCYCLQPTEKTFPDSMREEYLDPRSYGSSVLEKFNAGKNCPKTFCTPDLLPSPKGTVIGFW